MNEMQQLVMELTSPERFLDPKDIEKSLQNGSNEALIAYLDSALMSEFDNPQITYENITDKFLCLMEREVHVFMEMLDRIKPELTPSDRLNCAALFFPLRNGETMLAIDEDVRMIAEYFPIQEFTLGIDMGVYLMSDEREYIDNTMEDWKQNNSKCNIDWSTNPCREILLPGEPETCALRCEE